MSEVFYDATHRALLSDDEQSIALASLLHCWYVQGGVQTKLCVLHVIPYLIHASLDHLQQGKICESTTRVLLAMYNKEVQQRRDDHVFISVCEFVCCLWCALIPNSSPVVCASIRTKLQPNGDER